MEALAKKPLFLGKWKMKMKMENGVSPH